MSIGWEAFRRFRSVLLVGVLVVLLAAAVCGCGSSGSKAGADKGSNTTLGASSKVLIPVPVSAHGARSWGYIDSRGAWVIPAKFQSEDYFEEGLAPVEVDGKWGYINGEGVFAIKPKYTRVKYFRNGLALVATASRKDDSHPGSTVPTAYGWIDTSGKMVIPATWDDADYFTDGLAPVRRGNLCGYINEKGQVAIPLKYEAAGLFSEGLALVWSDGKMGYIDKTGAWAVKPQFEVFFGYAGVFHGSSLETGFGRFRDGFAPVLTFPRGPFYFIDKTGKRAFAQTYEVAGEFNEGLAPVKVGGKWGFIDKSGHMVIQPKFDDIPDYWSQLPKGFSQGLAAAQYGGKVGYIDKNGKFVIPASYVSGSSFTADGFAYVNINAGTLGVIDKTGKVIYQVGSGGSSSQGS